jgi:dTDP-4-amino-4,6-dideoxygalactose transaminase
MVTIGPLARLRIYTSPKQYARVALETLTGRTRRGDAVCKLEHRIADWVGANHAVAMPLARVGIYFAVKVLIKPGQKIIMSPYTIADVINMVICAGGVPVFADIERETCNIDPAEVERLIDENTGAVMVTHFYGLACDIKRIKSICKARGVPLIEDAAQAFGTRVNDKHVGTFGDIGIFSFGMFKNINAFYGGMVVTNNAELHARVASEMAKLPYQPMGVYLGKVLSALQTDIITFPLFFRPFFFWLLRYAFLHNIDVINSRLRIDVDPTLKTEMPQNYLTRMSPLQARLVLEQLDRVDRDTQKRIAAAKLYYAGLRDIPELILTPMRLDGSHMYWYFTIQSNDRHDLVTYAMRKGRDLTESYHRNCADLACFQVWHRDCPRARATADSLIYLPTYPRYSRREIESNIRVIRTYFGLSS